MNRSTLVLCLVLGCSSSEGRGSSRTRDAGSPRPVARDAGSTLGTPAEAPVVRRSRALMGTIFEIMAVGTPSRSTEDAMAAAFDEVARLEEMMSEWRPASQISRVNAAAGRSAVRVDPELLLVIQEGLRIARLSGGAFDISWAALRGLWVFKGDDPHPPTRAAARAAAKLVDWRDVIVDERARTVMLRRPGMAIGLGGIAKGYALDRAAEVLKAKGLRDFVIYGGGQVLVSGQKGQRPWRVGIQHPRRRDVYFAYFSPGPGSVSTSGDYEHYFIEDGVRYHHILDPTTGFPANESVAVTVVSPTGLAADAIDTALFILGPVEGMQLAKRLGIEALFIAPRMRVTMTEGFRRDLTMMPLEGSE